MTYFRENIASVKTAEDLVANRRLLKVALTAFGLEGEIDKKAFIRKVLEEGTGEGSMAARLNDPSWKNFSAAFGFDGDTAKTGNTGFADKILTSFKTKSYEIAVGKANDSMRLAMNFKREIADLAAGEGKSWYNVLGNKALRKVFEGAFGLPTAFAQVDLDQQVEGPAGKDLCQVRRKHTCGLSGCDGGRKDDRHLSGARADEASPVRHLEQLKRQLRGADPAAGLGRLFGEFVRTAEPSDVVLQELTQDGLAEDAPSARAESPGLSALDC